MYSPESSRYTVSLNNIEYLTETTLAAIIDYLDRGNWMMVASLYD